MQLFRGSNISHLNTPTDIKTCLSWIFTHYAYLCSLYFYISFPLYKITFYAFRCKAVKNICAHSLTDIKGHTEPHAQTHISALEVPSCHFVSSASTMTSQKCWTADWLKRACQLLCVFKREREKEYVHVNRCKVIYIFWLDQKTAEGDQSLPIWNF